MRGLDAFRGFGGFGALSGFRGFDEVFNPDASRRRAVASERGRDLETALSLSFAEAASGVTAAVEVAVEAPCGTCGGPVPCDRCGGSGEMILRQGFLDQRETCSACDGRGERSGWSCVDCGGRGRRPQRRTVRVRVPAGVRDGQVLRVSGRGEPGRNGGPAGDLFVLVQVSDRTDQH